jgi:ABC-type branched-subunit amino acid transport system permease subunit
MRRALWAALLVAAVALPFFFSSYRVSQFTLVLAYAVAALGLNLLLGYSGQISLGHGAFFALGAYTTAILVAKSGWPHLATIPVAAAVCFAAGFAVGIPALRLHGLYLALVTLGLAVATPQLIKRFEGLTGGTQGLSAAPPPVPGWLSFLADDQWLYLLNLAIAVPMFVLAAGIVRGRVGRALVAVRDNPIAARTASTSPPTRRARSRSAPRTPAWRARCSRSRSGSWRRSPSGSRCRSRSWPRSSSAGWRPWRARSSERCSSSSCRSTHRTSTRRSRRSSTAAS